MQLVVSSEFGLEDIVIDELSELGYHGEMLIPTRILIDDATEADIYHLCIAARTIHRVFVLIGNFECTTLQEIVEASSSVEFSNWMSPEQTFGIRGLREGDHTFGSMDMASEIGAVVVDHFKKVSGKRIPVNLDDPDVEIMAHLSDNRLLLLIPTSNCSLHKRIERPYQHFASLKPSIAAAMLRKSSWKKHQTLLDPLAGSGIIPIEAMLQSKNIVPGVLAPHSMFNFERLSFLDYQKFLKTVEVYKDNILHDNKITILAGDRYQRSVDGMKQNFSLFGFENEISVFHGDAEFLDYLNPGDVNCIVTNPPYGMRIGNPGVVKALYKNFARTCADKHIDEIVAITPRRHQWITSFTSNGYKLDFMQRFYFGRLNVYMMRLKAKDY